MFLGALLRMLQGKNCAPARMAVVMLYKPWIDQTSISHGVRMQADQERGVCCFAPNWDFKPGFTAALLAPVGTKLSLAVMPEFTNRCLLSGSAACG